MKYERVRTTHPYALKNGLRAWSIYHKVWDNDKLICECFEIRPIMWYAIQGEKIVTGKSRKEVIELIKY